MAEIRATVEQTDNGQVVRTVCRDCGALIVLPCRDELGEKIEPTDFALKWADLLICSRCDAEREQRRAEEDAAGALKDRIKHSGIPQSFLKDDLTFENMNREDGRDAAIGAAWAWADTPPGATAGVLLHGPPGTGKTRLAATATMLRLKQFPVTWCSVAHLLASLQTSFSNDDRKDAVSVLTGAGALVLDDLDKVKPSEWAIAQLFTAVDRRVSAGAPLFVTSNAAPHLLTERFGAPLTSRLLGYCRVFEFGGSDRRVVRNQVEGCD